MSADELAKGIMPDCSPDDFGKEVCLGFDSEGYERRYQVFAVAECPKCEQDVALVADTDGWIKGDDGRWHHDSYGPATGVCCDNLIVDSWDGCKVYQLPPPAVAEEHR